jgi:hypothetical protein
MLTLKKPSNTEHPNPDNGIMSIAPLDGETSEPETSSPLELPTDCPDPTNCIPPSAPSGSAPDDQAAA